MTTPSTTPSRLAVAFGVVPGGYARVGTTLSLKPLLEEFGVDLQQVLAESGLPPELFNHPDNLIPFRQGSRLLGLCADRTGCAHLGLLIGRLSPLESLGLVADLAKAAPDVRSALQLLARYMTLSDGGGLLMVREDSHIARYVFTGYPLPRSEANKGKPAVSLELSIASS